MEKTTESLPKMKEMLFTLILEDEWKAFEMGNRILKKIRKDEKEETNQRKILEDILDDTRRCMRDRFPWIVHFENISYEKSQCDLGWELFEFLEKMTGIVKKYRLDKINGSTQEIVEEIADNIEDRKTLSTVAKKLGIEKEDMSRLLKKRIGTSAADYCNLLKMEKAAAYLKEYGMDVIQVADKLGYVSKESFGKVFREKIGCRPEHYRKYE